MIGRLQTAVEYAGEEASPWGALKLIAGSANPELSQKISAQLNVPLTDPRLRRFPDGATAVGVPARVVRRKRPAEEETEDK